MRSLERIAALILTFAILEIAVAAQDPGLRELAFSGSQKDFGLQESQAPWAVIMETGFPEGSFTLVGLIDGSASIYFSSGGGVIGAGRHDSVAEASVALVRSAAASLESFKQVESHGSPPAPGEVILYVRKGGDLLVTSGKEDDFGEDRHPASSVFYAAHELISHIREVEEDGT